MEPTTSALTHEDVLDVFRTTCCIVGGGPGGAVLALLLARQGVDVMLLEAHKDFDRDFRGDTVHPSTLELLDEIGLAGRLHQLRHVKVFAPTLRAVGGSFTPFDLRRLKTRFPYIMLMHQPIFLDFVTEEAAKYSNFRLLNAGESYIWRSSFLLRTASLLYPGVQIILFRPTKMRLAEGTYLNRPGWDFQ